MMWSSSVYNGDGPSGRRQRLKRGSLSFPMNDEDPASDTMIPTQSHGGDAQSRRYGGQRESRGRLFRRKRRCVSVWNPSRRRQRRDRGRSTQRRSHRRDGYAGARGRLGRKWAGGLGAVGMGLDGATGREVGKTSIGDGEVLENETRASLRERADSVKERGEFAEKECDGSGRRVGRREERLRGERPVTPGEQLSCGVTARGQELGTGRTLAREREGTCGGWERQGTI